MCPWAGNRVTRRLWLRKPLSRASEPAINAGTARLCVIRLMFRQPEGRPVRQPPLPAPGRSPVQKGLKIGALGLISSIVAFIKTAIDSYAKDFGETAPLGIGGVFVLGIGSILIGVVLMVIWNITAPAFFRGETMRGKVAIGEQVQSSRRNRLIDTK